MFWNYCCDEYEDPGCGCRDEVTCLPDEDAAYEEERDRRSGLLEED